MSGVTFKMVGACIRWFFLFKKKSFQDVLEEDSANYWTGLILFIILVFTSLYFFEKTPQEPYLR